MLINQICWTTHLFLRLLTIIREYRETCFKVTVTLILVVEQKEYIFVIGVPKSIKYNRKISKINSLSGFDLFDLWPDCNLDIELWDKKVIFLCSGEGCPSSPCIILNWIDVCSHEMYEIYMTDYHVMLWNHVIIKPKYHFIQIFLSLKFGKSSFSERHFSFLLIILTESVFSTITKKILSLSTPNFVN